jgi:hypothetical protein
VHTFVFFLLAGLCLGFAMRLPAFGLVSVLGLIVYAFVEPTAPILGRGYDLLAAAIALQVGYGIAVALRFAWRKLMKASAGPANDSRD